MSASMSMPSNPSRPALGPAPNIPVSGAWTAPLPRSVGRKSHIDLGEVLARMFHAARRTKPGPGAFDAPALSAGARQQSIEADQNLLARLLQLLMNFLRKLAGHVNSTVGQVRAAMTASRRGGAGGAAPESGDVHKAADHERYKAQPRSTPDAPTAAVPVAPAAPAAPAGEVSMVAAAATPLAPGVPESWDPVDAPTLEVPVTSGHPALSSEFVASFLREQLDAFVDRLLANEANPMSLLADPATADTWLQASVEDITALKSAIEAQLSRHQADLDALVQRYAASYGTDPATVRAHLQDPGVAVLQDKEGHFAAIQRDIARATLGQRVLELTLQAFKDTQQPVAAPLEGPDEQGHDEGPVAQSLADDAAHAPDVQIESAEDPSSPASSAPTEHASASVISPAQTKAARVSPFARAVQPAQPQDAEDAFAQAEAVDADVAKVLQKIASADILANTIQMTLQDPSIQTGSKATEESERKGASAVVVPFRLKASDLEALQPLEQAGFDSLDRPRQ